MKKTYYVMAAVALLFAACTNSKENQDKLKKDVIAKHDTLMMQMDVLMAKKEKLDSINYHAVKAGNAELDTLKMHMDADSIKSRLMRADEAMMHWMHQFEPDFSGKTDAQIEEYLKEQQNKIDSVEVLFKKAISQADSLLERK